MNNKFGGMLRRELVDLIMAPELWRRRVNSTGSSGRSSSDGEEDERIFLDFSDEGKSMKMTGM
jgi:hypothetical protein